MNVLPVSSGGCCIRCVSVYSIYSIVNPRLQSRTIEGDLHFFLELIERSRSGAQRLGPHVAHEDILCGPQCFLGIFK